MMPNSVKQMQYSIYLCYIQVGAAALDVFEEEPPKNPVTLEIIQHPAVLATPHLGEHT